jgi:hypothetical protein
VLTEGGVDQRLGGGRVDVGATVVVPLPDTRHEPDHRCVVPVGPEPAVDGEQEHGVEQVGVPPPAGVVEAAQPMLVVAYPAGDQVTDGGGVRGQAVHGRRNSFQAS